MRKKWMKNTLAVLTAAVVSVAAFVTASAPEVMADTAPAGMVRSELTGEWIDASLQMQRPVAIMVDNEKVALPHYGLTEADIVYEMVNSTLNNRVTRFMAIVKDWGKIKQFGSIRSLRPTNIMLAAEYNAIIVHDGGPYHNAPYLAKPYINNLSGGFARFSNGKRTEFTEYVTYSSYTNPKTGKTYAGLGSRINSAGFSKTYNQYYGGQNMTFAPAEHTLDAYPGVMAAGNVDLPFPHNASKLTYNAATRTYDYSEYGAAHVDPLHNNQRLSFKNCIIMRCSFTQLDKNGYLVYNILGQNVGYYLTDGEIIPISWVKYSDTTRTLYYDGNGQEIQFNPGKTYIAVVPEDSWTQLKVY